MGFYTIKTSGWKIWNQVVSTSANKFQEKITQMSLFLTKPTLQRIARTLLTMAQIKMILILVSYKKLTKTIKVEMPHKNKYPKTTLSIISIHFASPIRKCCSLTKKQGQKSTSISKITAWTKSLANGTLMLYNLGHSETLYLNFAKIE